MFYFYLIHRNSLKILEYKRAIASPYILNQQKSIQVLHFKDNPNSSAIAFISFAYPLALAFTLTGEQMTVSENNGKRIIEPGEFLLSVGGKQPGFTGHADAQTTNTVSGKFVVKGTAAVVP